MNAVKDQFFDNRFKEFHAGEDYLREKYRHTGQGGSEAMNAIHQASMLSTSNVAGSNLELEAHMHKANKEYNQYENPAHGGGNNFDYSFGRGKALGGSAVQMGKQPAGDQVLKLQEDVTLLQLELTGKDA